MDTLDYFVLGASVQAKYHMKDGFRIRLIPPHYPHRVYRYLLEELPITPSSQPYELKKEAIELELICENIWCAYDKEENVLFIQSQV